ASGVIGTWWRCAGPRTLSADDAPTPPQRRYKELRDRDDRPDRADELCFGLRTDELLLDLSAVDHEQRGDAADAILRRCLRVVVDVHLDDLELAVVLAGQLLDDRGDGATRGAPGCPEVDQDRSAGLEDLALEGLVGHRQNVSHAGSVAEPGYRRK